MGTDGPNGDKKSLSDGSSRSGVKRRRPSVNFVSVRIFWLPMTFPMIMKYIFCFFFLFLNGVGREMGSIMFQSIERYLCISLASSPSRSRLFRSNHFARLAAAAATELALLMTSVQHPPVTANTPSRRRRRRRDCTHYLRRPTRLVRSRPLHQRSITHDRATPDRSVFDSISGATLRQRRRCVAASTGIRNEARARASHQ